MQETGGAPHGMLLARKRVRLMYRLQLRFSVVHCADIVLCCKHKDVGPAWVGGGACLCLWVSMRCATLRASGVAVRFNFCIVRLVRPFTLPTTY